MEKQLDRDPELDSKVLEANAFLYQLEPPVLRSVIEIFEWVLDRVNKNQTLPTQRSLDYLMDFFESVSGKPPEYRREYGGDDDIPFESDTNSVDEKIEDDVPF